MTDPTLRLPTRAFRAVLDLGALPLAGPSLPARFQNADFDLDWHDDNGVDVAAFYIEFPDGQLHAEAGGGRLEFHFHDGAGEDADESPWPVADTQALLGWTERYIAHIVPLLPDLLADIDEAREWCELGLPIYTRDFEPIPLEIIEVEVEGDLLMLPWLGAGHVDHSHFDGPDLRIALLWSPDHEPADRPIAKAWLDAETGQPTSAAEPGIDWVTVGLTEAEVLSWFDGFYLNHQVIADPGDLLRTAALERIAGLKG